MRARFRANVLELTLPDDLFASQEAIFEVPSIEKMRLRKPPTLYVLTVCVGFSSAADDRRKKFPTDVLRL